MYALFSVSGDSRIFLLERTGGNKLVRMETSTEFVLYIRQRNDNCLFISMNATSTRKRWEVLRLLFSATYLTLLLFPGTTTTTTTSSYFLCIGIKKIKFRTNIKIRIVIISWKRRNWIWEGYKESLKYR